MAVDLDATFEQFRLKCIADGEREHEAVVLTPFPHRVRLQFNEDLDTNCDRMFAITAFLNDRLDPHSFSAFPGTSVGKYKEDVYCVFFRNSCDALLMKLTL